jgi:hypothetical protein
VARLRARLAVRRRTDDGADGDGVDGGTKGVGRGGVEGASKEVTLPKRAEKRPAAESKARRRK